MFCLKYVSLEIPETALVKISLLYQNKFKKMTWKVH